MKKLVAVLFVLAVIGGCILGVSATVKPAFTDITIDSPTQSAEVTEETTVAVIDENALIPNEDNNRKELTIREIERMGNAVNTITFPVIEETPVDLESTTPNKPDEDNVLDETITEPEKPTETEPQVTEPAVTEPKKESAGANRTDKPQNTEPVKETKPSKNNEPEKPAATTQKNESNTNASNKTESTKKENKVVYQQVDEYLYVSSSTLNVRKGPGTAYDKIASLIQNDQVHRIAIGDNGWSQIEYYTGQIHYVSSQYLSRNQIKNVTFHDVDKTMYTAREWVSIYVEPTKNSVSTTTFGSANSELKVTGESTDKQWYRVKYDGKVGYMKAGDLSIRKIRDSVSSEMSKRSGMMGRLYIDDVNIDVALFKQKLGVSSQGVVDNHDSAAYLPDNGYYGFDIIADHRHQGFVGIRSVYAKHTIAVIDFGSYTKSYICVDRFTGRNTVADLVDMDGKSIRGRNDGGICMYTCNYDDTITISFWQPV
jgi:hypothetical protein